MKRKKQIPSADRVGGASGATKVRFWPGGKAADGFGPLVLQLWEYLT
jgi:hypothetical protein